LAYFHRACIEKNIEHFFSRPRTPKDNAVCERFNQTLQRGFYWRCDLEKTISEINQELLKWLIEYNIKRPHESLSFRPPCAVYFNKFYISRPQEMCSRLLNRTPTSLKKLDLTDCKQPKTIIPLKELLNLEEIKIIDSSLTKNDIPKNFKEISPGIFRKKQKKTFLLF